MGEFSDQPQNSLEYKEYGDSVMPATDLLGKNNDSKPSNVKKCQDLDYSEVFSMKYKLFRTVVIVLSHMSLGVYLEVTGPTLQELMSRVGANYEQMGRVLTTRSLGYLLSSLTAGVLADIFSHHIEVILGCAYLLGAVGTVFSPWCTSLGPLFFLKLIQGLGCGTSDLGQNLLILRIWREKAAAPMYALHMGFGVGAFIAPQLVKPFLVETMESTRDWNGTNDIYRNGTKDNMYAMLHENTTEPLSARSRSPIEIPYAIAAINVMIYAIANFAIFSYEKRRYRIKKDAASNSPEVSLTFSRRLKTGLKILSPGACTGGKKLFGVMFFILFYVYFANIVGSERVISKFLFSFAKDANVSFTNHQAANLNSVFWFSFMGGRLLGVFISLCLSTKIFLFILLSVHTVTAIFLVLYGYSTPIALWILSALFGVSLGPLFPACASWANMYVEMRGIAVGVMTVGAATGAMIYQWVAGYFFEYVGPQSIMQILLAAAVIVTSDFILLVILSTRHGKKLKSLDIATASENGETKYELSQ